MSSRSASALLDAALAVPFDPEQEDRRQLSLAAQEQWPQGPVQPTVLDVAPEVQQLPPPPMQIAPDPIVAQADAAMAQGIEPPLPTRDGAAEEDLPPVVPPGAGSMEQGVTRQGGGRRSASALLADVQEPGVGSGQQGGGGQTSSRRSASALLADLPDAAPVNVEGRTILGTIGDAFKRGWTMGDLAREMEAPQPNADRVFALQAEMRKLPPSPEYVTTMRDDVSPAESWQAFKSNPVVVLGELMGESLAAFGNQMIEKAPNRVAIGLGAGAAMGAPVVGIGAVPGGFMGAGAGFAEASGAASYALEMSSGILEALEKSGVPMDDPQAMRAALADPERMQVAREFAQRKAVPIAIFDGGSALIAGRLGGKPASALAKVGEGFAETFLQGAMGAAGEASGQLAQSGEIRSARAILAEGVAEVPTGLAEIGVGALTQNAADANRPAGTAPAAAAAAPSGVQAPWQAAREQAVPTVTRVEVVGDDVFGEPTTAAVERPVATGDERFAPPAEAAAPAPAAAGTTASVPMMITRQMEADLLARGFSQQEINAMTPQQANEILAGAGQRTAGPAMATTSELNQLEATLRASWPTFSEEQKLQILQALREKAGRPPLEVPTAAGPAAEPETAGAGDSAATTETAPAPKDVREASLQPAWLRENRDAWVAMYAMERPSETDYRLVQNPDGQYQIEQKLGKEWIRPYAPSSDVRNLLLRGGMAETLRKAEEERVYWASRAPAPAAATATAAVAPAAEPTSAPAAKPKRTRKAAAKAAPMPVAQMSPTEINEGVVGMDMGTRQWVVSRRTGRGAEQANKTNHEQAIAQAMGAQQPVNAEAVDNYGMQLPQGYAKEGNLYVYKPEAAGRDAAFDNFQRNLDQSPDRNNPNVYVPGKAAWEVARSVWVGLQPPAYQDRAALGHEVAVKQAVADGQTVSPEVLKDYPDVKPSAAPSKDPQAPAKARRRIQRKLRPDAGAVDLSIVEDLVEYGRTIYRAGMDYATWAAAMTREFGQAVAQFLRQAFDRIVAAYQASRFSDTTGAVGDVRPKAKPRQFEAKARQNEALAPETRERLGSSYIPISLNAQATEAKEWINTNGLEAAKLRIAQLSGNDTVPTPVDFAIGIEAAGRLSATGDHAGAAGIVSTMSQRATSLGQTISVLAMMARLTPEGIVLYGQNIVSRYINTLPQEAQDRIKALQAEVDRLRTALAEMKFKEGSEVIRSGKLGDEKIQDRIKRRVKARVQADLGPAAAGPEVTAETKARTQGLNRKVRDVLLSDGKQSEMIKQITQILTSEGNMPAAEAEAVGKSIVAAFTKIVTETRRNYVQGAKQGGGARKAKADALLKMLTTQREMTDAEFVAEVSQLMGLPGMTPALARELRQLGQRYENATDPDVKLVLAATMFERAHEVVPADFWVKVRAFGYLSMLFAPKTWIRNVIGNQIQWIFNVGRDAVVAGIMDPAMSLLTGQRTTAGLKLGARLKGLLAPIEDVRRGYLANKQFNPEANFRQNFMAGVNHLRMLSKLTTQNKFEIADVRDVGARIFSSKLMRAWEGTLSIALGAGDRAFWMSQFRASLAQMQAAAEKNGEWTGQPTPEMIEAAMAEAAYAIYQNQNIISANANKIRGALNRLSTFGKTDQYGLGTGLMAFTQVPGSITLRGLVEWSPLGMIPALYRGMRGILYASSTGRIGAKFDQAAFNKEFTQALLGTGALYAAGYYLYALGIVTASREDDEDLEAMRRASGGGAYRINLTALRRALLSGNWFTRQEGEQGDVIVPYDWAQPVAITFAAGAELAAQVERSGREQLKKGLAEKAGMAAMSLAAGAKSLEELPLLSGLSSFIKTWGYAGPLEATTATVAGMPSQFVPQLVRQAGQINDNLVRETRGGDSVIQREFMKVLASVPGYSTKFPVRFDITGQAIQRYQYGGNSVMNVFFSPAMASEVKRNPVLQEVSRLVDTTGETSMVPRQVKRSAKINGVDVDLTNEQLAAYSYYLGNFTMSHFAWRMAAPVYARLPDEMKVKMLAQDITDIDAAVKSAVLGHDPRRLTRNQMFLRQALVNSPLGQSVPPR